MRCEASSLLRLAPQRVAVALERIHYSGDKLIEAGKNLNMSRFKLSRDIATYFERMQIVAKFGNVMMGLRWCRDELIRSDTFTIGKPVKYRSYRLVRLGDAASNLRCVVGPGISAAPRSIKYICFSVPTLCVTRDLHPRLRRVDFIHDVSHC